MQARLNASDPGAIDLFGQSVSIDADTAIVGAQADDHAGGTDAGSAYVFVHSGPTWSQPFKLTAPDAAAFDSFGYAVSISGDTAVVTAPFNDNAGGDAAGAAYVFLRDGGGTSWSQQAKLMASDGGAFDVFGTSCAIDGNTVVIGAQGDMSAYVFVRTGFPGREIWTQQAKLTELIPDEDSFGVSVSIAGDTVIVGASTNDHVGGINAGAAYVFVRSGTVWTQQAKLTAFDAAPNDQFGVSVSIAANTAIVGAHTDDYAGGVDAGSAYVFVRSGTVWSGQAKLIGSDTIANDNFGWSVSVAPSGNMAIVGANIHALPVGPGAGAAYTFVRPGGSGGTTWSQKTKITASDGAGGDQFGFGVSITRDTALIGAFSVNAGAPDAGAAYVVALGDNTCRVDINGDDLVNIDDLLNVINGWGVCP
jgi:hypothetical protein